MLLKVDARQVKGVAAIHPWKNQRRIDRDRLTPSPVDALTIVVLGVDGYREAIPKPQLAEVGIEHEVSLAAIFKIAITVAGRQPLIELCQSRGECDAMFFQPSPVAAPIAGERITFPPTG